MTTIAHNTESLAEQGTDPLLRATLVAVGSCGLVIVATALGVFGVRTALSVGLGAAAALLNLWLVARVVTAMMQGGGTGWLAVGGAKLAVLLGGLYLLHRLGWIELLALVAGYGALPLGIVIAGLRPTEPVRVATRRSSEGA